MSTTSSDAWSSTLSLGGNFGDVIESERTERFELQEAMSRWLFNFHHHFYDDECNGEMSMNMIVRMKVFSAEMQKGKLMFAQAAVFNPQ